MQSRKRQESVGKAIYFAPHTLTVPDEGPWLETLRHPPEIDQLPDFADIPPAGQVIEAGRPVLTFFSRGPDEETCLQRLRQTAASLDRLLANG